MFGWVSVDGIDCGLVFFEWVDNVGVVDLCECDLYLFWGMCVFIVEVILEIVNEVVFVDLMGGVLELEFNFDLWGEIGFVVNDVDVLDVVFKGVDLFFVLIYFDVILGQGMYVYDLFVFYVCCWIDGEMFEGGLGFNLIGCVVCQNVDLDLECFDKVKVYVQFCQVVFLKLKIFCVDGVFVFEVGVIEVQEFVVMVGKVVVYMCLMGECGMSVDEVFQVIEIKFVVDIDIYFIIVKLWVVCWVFVQIVSSFGVMVICVNIYVVMVGCMFSVKDLWINLICNVCVGFVVVVGGVDSIIICLMIDVLGCFGSFVWCVVCNFYILFVEESYIGKVIDLVVGGYLYEYLIEQLV